MRGSGKAVYGTGFLGEPEQDVRYPKEQTANNDNQVRLSIREQFKRNHHKQSGSHFPPDASEDNVFVLDGGQDISGLRSFVRHCRRCVTRTLFVR